MSKVKSSSFTDASSGRLVPTIERQMAFVPAPLPPNIDLAAIALPMASAMQAIGELRGACRRLQNPSILVSPLQRQEALTSSAMEGTFTTADRLILAEAGLEGGTDESTREVNNYLEALNNSLKMLKDLPLSHRILKSAHAKLLGGLSRARGSQKRPGEYKRDQNWIGGRTIENARFVPPPPIETLTCMDQLEAYLNKEKSFPSSIIDLALVHYQLETIHPFADGNGRVGRMLISLMAVNTRLLDIPVLYMSPSLEQSKDTYIDLMLNVSTKGEWTPWLVYFFGMITESCIATISTIDRLIALQERYRSLAMESGRSTNAARLVDVLFEHPALTITSAASKLSVTYPSAKTAVEKLVALDVLQSFERTYPKVYYAPSILKITQNMETKEGAYLDVYDAEG